MDAGNWIMPLGGACAGASIGSWLATIAIRWPHGKGATTGRSRCDACGTVLPPAALVPILSYVVLRGRCRACGARIAPLHAIVEVAAAVLGALSFALLPWPLAIAGLGFGLMLLLLAVLDLTQFWLPDRVTLPLLAAGLGCSVAGLGPAPIDAAVGAIAGYASLAIVAALYVRLRGRTGLGGGDPKLFAAIGAWTGWASLPIVLTIAAATGLLVLLGLRITRRVKLHAALPVPFGALLAASAWPLWVALMR